MVEAKVTVVEDSGSEPPMISLIEDQVDTEGALEELEAAMAAASATPPIDEPGAFNPNR